MSKLTQGIAMAALVALLAGCAGVGADQVAKETSSTAQAKLDKMNHGGNTTPWFQMRQGPYIGTQVIKNHQGDALPALFDKSITLVSAREKSLAEAAAFVGSYLNVGANLGTQAAGSKDDKHSHGMKINYSGTVKGLLDAIASHFNVFWTWDKDSHSILFNRYKTRTWALPVLANSVDVGSSMSNSTRGGGRGGAGGGGGGGQSGGTGGAQAQAGQNIKSGLEVNLWKGIDAGVKSLLSDGGHVTINKVLGTVLVKDTPSVLGDVNTYLDHLVGTINKEVLLTVRVYAVNMNKSSANGFSLAAVFKSLDGNFGLNLDAADSLVDLSGAGGTSIGILPTATGAVGQWAGSNAMVQALSQYGNASVVTTSSGIAMQGIPIPIQITDTKGYIAQQSTTTTANVGAQIGVQTSQITTGFSMLVTPRISHAGVIMQYALNISKLNKLKTIDKKDIFVQLPDTSSRQFLQRAKLKWGQTLVISGFLRSGAEKNHNGGLASYFEGGKRSRNMIVVTIKASRVKT
jgi:type IVB pilus formation R64 PilN family outer membrane protein